MRTLYYTPYTDDVEQFVAERYINTFDLNQSKVLYVVPTMFLYRRRLSQLRYHVNKVNLRHSSDALELDRILEIKQFEHWIRELIYSNASARLPLSRSETHVMVKRAIKDTYVGRKDWEAVSFRLFELFMELDQANFPRHELSTISSFDDWQSVLRIYDRYLELLAEHDQRTYYQQLHELLLESDLLSPYREVVFDGSFLFLNTIHEKVIEKFEREGKDVSFIIPYYKGIESTNPAFRVVEQVYSVYVPMNDWQPIGKRFLNDTTDLEQIRNTLFTDESIQVYSNSFSIQSHATLEEEVRHVIREAKQAILSQETNSKGILIVTPNAMELRPLVREIAEQEQLQVEVPRRSLLGLTSGEFIRLLYKSKWDAQRLDRSSYLDCSMFRRILDSGWFVGVEASLNAFYALEEAFFSDCFSIEEWKVQISRLQGVKRSSSIHQLAYHPLHAVTEKDLLDWCDVLDGLEQLHGELMEVSSHTLSQHANKLLEALTELADRYGFSHSEYGENVLMRIRTVVETAATQDRLPISSQEFGDMLHQFMVEEEEASEADALGKPKEILVTGPENLVFLSMKYVYMIQFTQDRFPQLSKPQWPIHTDLAWQLAVRSTRLNVQSIGEWEQLLADREKYYFYLTFFVPQIGMQISYARNVAGERTYPSHYLYDLAQLFQINQVETDVTNGKPKRMEQLLEQSGVLHVHRPLISGESRSVQIVAEARPMTGGDRLTLDDLGIYRLCPKRYLYMKTSPESNLYTTKFQFERYIAALLTTQTAEKLFEVLSKETINEQLFDMKRRNQIIFQDLPAVLHDVEEQLRHMFPVNRQLWQQGAYYARRFVENMIRNAFDEKQAKIAHNSGSSTLPVRFKVADKTVVQQVQGMAGNYLISGSVALSVKFGGTTRPYYVSHYQHMLGISSYELQTPDQSEEKFGDWYYRFRRGFFSEDLVTRKEIEGIIRSIEQGMFAKQPGEHCSYCPFIMTCQKSGISEPTTEE